MTAFAANEAELCWLNNQNGGSAPAPADGAKLESRAEFLRCLILDLAIAGADGNAQAMVARFGLRVTGARIAGRLDLVDGRSAAGGALPPLLLEDCDIPDEIDLSGAHLARLSVKSSRIAHITARGLRLDGNLDFSWVYGVDPPPGDQDDAMDWVARQGIWLDERRPLAWIDASGARIDGDVEGHGAMLCAPRKREQVPPGAERYALRLSNCTVGGRVYLMDGFAAMGGVNISDADIRGGVWLRGAALSAGEGSAFRAQSARFGSVLGLDDGFKATGEVSLYGAQIAGTLQCTDATFCNPGGTALIVVNAEIGGDALLRGEKFKATGEISLYGAKITGTLECSDATFSNPSGNALSLAGAEIGGAALLRGEKFNATGEVSLVGAKITGNLECSDATFSNPGGNALSLINAEIGGAALLGGEKFTATGEVSLVGAKITGTLVCDNATFSNPGCTALSLAGAEIGGAALLGVEKFTTTGEVTLLGAKITGTLACDNATFSNPGRTALSLAGAEIGGAAQLRREKFNATGEVSLLGAKITGTLECGHATFSNPGGNALIVVSAGIGGNLSLNETVVLGEVALWGTHVTRGLDAIGAHLLSHRVALSAGNLHVDGSVSLNGAELVGIVHCPNLEVKGGLDWSGVRIKGEVTRDGETIRSGVKALNFRNAHFGLHLVAKDLLTDPESLLLIDLGDARVATLDDDWPGGWGGEAAVRADRLYINLDGFLYDRFHECPSERIDLRFQEWLARLIEGAEMRLTALDEAPRGVGRQVRSWHVALHRCCTMLKALLDWLHARLRLDKLNRHSARHRIEWLRLQPRVGAAAFYPQPYRHLARVLRAHGHAEAAREAGIAEGWAAPAGFWYRWLGLRQLFGWLFGFGLAPGRAALTLLAFLIVLSIGVWQARNRDALVLTTTPVVSVVTQTEGVPRAAMAKWEGQPGQSAVAEPLCRDEIVPVFYAADLMIPAIPLHQETKCEVSLRPELWWLRWLKEIFSILGKIVTTLALITFSGVLNVRPQE